MRASASARAAVTSSTALCLRAASSAALWASVFSLSSAFFNASSSLDLRDSYVFTRDLGSRLSAITGAMAVSSTAMAFLMSTAGVSGVTRDSAAFNASSTILEALSMRAFSAASFSASDCFAASSFAFMASRRDA